MGLVFMIVGILAAIFVIIKEGVAEAVGSKLVGVTIAVGAFVIFYIIAKGMEVLDCETAGAYGFGMIFSVPAWIIILLSDDKYEMPEFVLGIVASSFLTMICCLFTMSDIPESAMKPIDHVLTWLSIFIFIVLISIERVRYNLKCIMFEDVRKERDAEWKKQSDRRRDLELARLYMKEAKRKRAEAEKFEIYTREHGFDK